jgi:hypothetical protein
VYKGFDTVSESIYKPIKYFKKMNTLVKTFAIVLGLNIANQALAQQTGSVSIIDNPNYLAKMVTETNSNTMKVYVGNIANKNLTISVKDAKGNALYTKKISKKEPQAYIRLDMAQLEDGIYDVELSDIDTKEHKSFRKGAEVIVSRPVGTLVAVN